MRRHAPHRFEMLEPRLAMAGMVTFSDIDGDTVTVRTNRGTDTLLTGAVLLMSPGFGPGMQLRQVNLTNPAFAGTNLTITARPSVTGGNGRVDIGELYTTLDLGTVTIAGDVGRIEVGDSNTVTPGIASLTVDSIGAAGTSTGAPDNVSYITGAAPLIRLVGNLTGARVVVGGRAADVVIGGTINGVNANDGFEAQSIGRMVVRGGIWGGNTSQSGRVQTTVGGIDRLVVGGDVAGGIGYGSGQIFSTGRLAAVRIDGFLRGGVGIGSGQVYAGAAGIGRVVVGRSIEGGPNDFAGSVQTLGGIGTAVVGGSIRGDAGIVTGAIVAVRGIGTLDVGEDIVGGAGAASGIVQAHTGRLGTLRVRNIVSGSSTASGVVAGFTIGDVRVRGAISGNALQPVIIAAEGSTSASGPRAINSIRVRGDMVRASILGGYSGVAPSNGAARIGSVAIGGNFEASNIVAGLENPVTPGRFGVPGDVVAIGGSRGSRIDSITVAGSASGTPGFFGESFGVAAAAIGRVQIGGRTRTVTAAGFSPGGDNLLFHLV